ncbi:uncharacterized protein ASPGLDRAFT_1439052 [Aspergillus glaucus CBS 516.65]|uniref:Methyltransferase type 11 domain-containing protein n=1 Tax=Aspergillus glaucus CBS 516.65 TaxID=1160497 RepID=A0A1L9VN17_ASPGL|nr:hypothetical protein ASPGLDRAFT_1439052 [Aspergillus glaucus CBS 516.65]OJJ85272.1 hypothetical protein ASPGLDRAFT_1439052 [Aspergillus glaucus CBS 516.65]
MLYKSDGGRFRPRYLMSQTRNTSSVTDSTKKSDVSPISPSSRSQATARQTQADHSSKTKRSSLLSNAEEARPNVASRQSRSDVRLSLLPRPAAQNQTSNGSQTANRTTQLTVKFEKQTPDEDQPRNMLRRKAPTIGQPKKPNGQGPEKLRVVIPNSSRPGQFMNATPRLSAQGDMAKNSPSSSIQQSHTVNKDAEPAIQGPKELASLRTTIDTQNLLPPTFALHSASSLSTKCSESPGIWSRGSTPTTTISSCSPGVFYSPKIGHSRHFSPSETRLPVYSPLTQISSPLSESDRKSIRSPSLDKATASLASLVNSEQEEPPRSTDSPRSHLSPKSALPRRTSVYSSLPTRMKANTPPSAHKDQQESEKNVAETLGSPTVPNKLKNSGSAPSRPTRDGTDQLELEPSPVIRSDLPPKIVSNHKRRESVEKNSTSKSSTHSATASTDSLNTRRQSRIPSQSTSQAMSQKPPRTSSKERSEKQDTKSPTTPSSATTRRFGLFPKKPKPESDAQASAQYRLPRKGPAARTGHEGYGRYAQRDRRMSTSSNSSATRTRSTSTTENTPKPTSSRKESLKNRPDLEIDDFLRNRLEPVVISGGGGGGGMDGRPSLLRTQSEQSAMSGCSTISPSNTAQNVQGAYSTACSTDSLATLSATAGDPSMKPRTNSEGGGQSGAPISRLGGAFHRAVASQPSFSRTSSQARSEKPPNAPQEKGRKKSFRSFFQRSHSKPRKNSTTTEAPPSSAAQLPAQVTPVSINRPVAHYALLDTDPDSLEDVMHDIEDSPPTDYDYSEPSPPVEVPDALKIRKSTLLPSPPRLQTELNAGWQSPPKVYMNKGPAPCKPGPKEKPVARRPSRLASIGRIPQVISRKDRQHIPAAQSFSRPFSMAEAPSLAAPVLSNGFQVPTCSEEMGRRPSEPTRLGFDLTQPFGGPTYGDVLDLISGPYSNNEFLRFSPDKNSPPSSFESTPAVTAPAPQPGSDLTDDEVWKEYDDLIDDVLSPISPKTTLPDFATSDAEEKLGLAALANQTLQNELDAPRLSTLFEQPSITLNRASQSSDGGSVRLRRSRIAAALRSSYTPSSQPSYSDLNAAQEGAAESEKDRPSSPFFKPVEEQQSFPLSPLNPSQSFEACRQRNTILFDIAERDREGPTAQTNIRSGSLMTSRWLSFGRVLFSPAHNHVKSGEQERILVIDGLGNDDWSFYCALTYANADVYNLHVGPTPAASSHPAAWQPPTNHHTVYHADLADRFPFPMGHFAATVLRLPAACSESVQDNVVSECKRVLRAGGYMEMSIMDLDMVNMGIRTRKAVRGLKERTYVADPSISLKPTSDSIQRLLGRHAFDNLHRCMVRIPVAGVITRSSASSSSTSSSSLHPSMSIPAATRSAPSFGQSPNNPYTTKHNKHGKSHSNDTDLSLGDLLSDPVPSPSNDESIRKIVAKVGRWWYTRCYEIPVLPDGDVDLRIWNDRKVLRECQKKGTGFRLLIAHAQKPSEVNRRTASV